MFIAFKIKRIIKQIKVSVRRNFNTNDQMNLLFIHPSEGPNIVLIGEKQLDLKIINPGEEPWRLVCPPKANWYLFKVYFLGLKMIK